MERDSRRKRQGEGALRSFKFDCSTRRITDAHCFSRQFTDTTGSPSVNTLIKLADALKVEIRDLITFPEENERDRVMELLRAATPGLRIAQL
jgi:hypothetical protein